MADAPVSKDLIYRVARLLIQEQITYAYMGGVALNVWGIPRATFDLDLTLSVTEDRVGPLLQSFQRDGWLVEPAFLRGHRDRVGEMATVHAQIPAGGSLLTADFFLARSAFLQSVLERRVSFDLGEGPLFVVTAADLLLFKVVAGRRKDLVDIDNILAVQGVPDRVYLDRWASTLGVSDRLAAVLGDRK